RVLAPDGQTTMRNYSLSDKPHGDWFRISVKREDGANAKTPAGFVSNHLHNDVEVGASLEVGPPCGDFYLETKSRRALVLLAAGVGITPLYSMLLSALEKTPEREITFIHACLHEGMQAFKSDLEHL